MSQPKRIKHGPFGTLLGLLTLVLPGVVAMVVAAFRHALPPGWLQGPVWMSDGGARAFAFILGVGLLVVARGYFSFRRIGWLGYVVWALASAMSVVASAVNGPAIINIEGFSLLVVLGLPYLWIRRRDFDIGPRSNVAHR